MTCSIGNLVTGNIGALGEYNARMRRNQLLSGCWTFFCRGDASKKYWWWYYISLILCSRLSWTQIYKRLQSDSYYYWLHDIYHHYLLNQEIRWITNCHKISCSHSCFLILFPIKTTVMCVFYVSTGTGTQRINLAFHLFCSIVLLSRWCWCW